MSKRLFSRLYASSCICIQIDEPMNSKNKIAQTYLPWILAVTGLSICLLLSVRWSGFKKLRSYQQDRATVEASVPELNAVETYTGSSQCRSCHPGEHDSWYRTFHRTMTQTAVGDHVLGRFDGTEIQSDGLTYRVFKEGHFFKAEMPDPDEMMFVVQGGKPGRLEDIERVERTVVMTTGSHHYQTYWVESPRFDRLLQTLPLVYLIEDQRWIPREAAFMRGPEDRHRFITQWNHHCIRCHSTAGVPGLNDETGLLESRVGELGISCEACHGPGQQHIEKHRNPLTRYRSLLSGEPDDSIVNPAKLDPKRSTQVCGQCHGVFVMEDEYAMDYAYKGPIYRPGDDLHKTRYFIQYPRRDDPDANWEELRKNRKFFRERWWDDGTILAGGREYTALAVSDCYTKGSMSCLSCHSMHDSDPVDQLTKGMETNRACVQCHIDPQYNESLRKHTHHDPTSSGSQCMNCHMPHTTYALLGAIRSHQIESPDPSRSIRFGTPNACNLCHLDQTLEWTQQTMGEWYDYAPIDTSKDEKEIAASLLWLIKGHAAQRAIVSWHLGWETALDVSGKDWMAPFQALLLKDSYEAVRYIAQRQLKKLPGFESFSYDFLSHATELDRVANSVQLKWAENSVEPVLQENPARLLLETNGELMHDRIEKLLEERDNRFVTIKE